MKKFFSFFMGLFITMGAIAAPQFALKKEGKEPKKMVKTERHIAPVYQAKADGQTITIEANNLDFTIESFYGIVEYGNISGGTEAWTVKGGLFVEDNNYYTTYSSDSNNIMLSVYDVNDVEIELYVSSAELKSTAKGDQFIATGVDETGNTYDINLTLFAPDQAKDTVNIVFGEIKSIKYFSGNGDYYIQAGNANYYAALDIYTDELEGTYAKSDFYLQYTKVYTIQDGDTASAGSLFDAKAQIVLVGDVYQIAAELYMTDSICYRLSMTYTKPTYTDTVAILFAEPVSIDNYYGDFYLTTKNDQFLFYLDYYSNTITGEFNMKNGDFYENYCALFTINGTDTTYVGYNDLSAVVTEDKTNYYVEAKYYGKNNTLYILKAFSIKPVAEDTVLVVDDNAKLTDYSAYGMFQVVAITTDETTELYITLNSYELEGSFTADDINAKYSGIIIGEDQYQIVDGKFTTSIVDNALVMQGWILGKNNVLYQLNLSAPMSFEGIENIELSEKVQKVVIDGALYIIRDNKLFNVQGVQVR